MWNKSIAGFICGLLTMVLLPSGISFILKEQLALVMALMLIFGLSSWAVIMTWCYAAPTGKKAWFRGGLAAIPSFLIYIICWFMFGGH